MGKFGFLKHRFRSVRKPLKWLFRGVTMRIRGGPLQGKRWHITTRSRFLLGTYEPAQTRLFQQTVKAGDVVYDIGAHVGHYTILASVLVGNTGQVIAFEPVPANLYYLRDHVQMNDCDNVMVIAACVAEASGTGKFQRMGTGSGHISENGQLAVRTVTLDELIQAGTIPAPDCMKIDVEGAEYLVLQGGKSLITRTHPVIFLSLHGEQVRRQCYELLTTCGYHLRPIGEEPLAKAREVLARMGD